MSLLVMYQLFEGKFALAEKALWSNLTDGHDH